MTNQQLHAWLEGQVAAHLMHCEVWPDGRINYISTGAPDVDGEWHDLQRAHDESARGALVRRLVED